MKRLLVVCAGLLAAAGLVHAQASASDGIRIKFGVPSNIAPFVMPNRDTGLLVDVFREALATQGAGAEFVYLPDNRAEEALRTGWVDAAGMAKPAGTPVGILSHWPIAHFRNMAITLRVRIPRLNGLEDLSHYRVNAFKGASLAMGGAYQEATSDNPSYRETVNRPSSLLLLGQLDVIVSQPDIFRYYMLRQSKLTRADDSEIAYHDILGKGVDYWFQFRTAEQRELFEKGLATLYRSGAVEKIFDRYKREYGTSRDFFRPLDCQFLAAKPRGCPAETGKPG